MAVATKHRVLSDDILARCAERAPVYDRENRFFGEDFEELRQAGYLGIHGMDTSDPAAPKIVHAFLPRHTQGVTIQETWDVLGMRAIRSDDTVLEGAFVPDQYIARVVSAGGAGIDLFVLGVFAWALLGFGHIYYGLAQRVFDWTLENIKKKTSIAMSRP